MLRGNPPTPNIPFFLFLSIAFPSLFQKKSENFGGGLNPLNPPPLKYALDIPNEALIEANKETRKIILYVFNMIYSEEVIPKKWSEGKIIRIYKGKGKKGKCSNERGITLSSNSGKLFERIINNRIKEVINMTPNQGGGIKGKSTADHLLRIINFIKANKLKKQKPILVFLDVTKAYDKAWNKAIMYALDSSGSSEG